MKISLLFPALWIDPEVLEVLKCPCKLSSTTGIPSFYLYLPSKLKQVETDWHSIVYLPDTPGHKPWGEIKLQTQAAPAV